MPTNTSRRRPQTGRRSPTRQTRSQFLGRGTSAKSGQSGQSGRSFGRGQAASGRRARPKGFGGRPNPARKPASGRGRRSSAKSGGLGGLLSKLPTTGGGKRGLGRGKASKGKGAPAAALLAAGAGALLGGRKLKQRRSSGQPAYGTENVTSVNENPAPETAPTPSPMTPPSTST